MIERRAAWVEIKAGVVLVFDASGGAYGVRGVPTSSLSWPSR